MRYARRESVAVALADAPGDRLKAIREVDLGIATEVSECGTHGIRMVMEQWQGRVFDFIEVCQERVATLLRRSSRSGCVASATSLRYPASLADQPRLRVAAFGVYASPCFANSPATTSL